MKRIILCLSVLSLASLLSAQDTASVRFMNTITTSELSEHVHALASPAFEGRGTGSEGIQMAAEYIRGQLSESGVENALPGSPQAYFQPYHLEKSYWKGMSLSSETASLSAVTDFIFFNDPFTLDRTCEMVFAGFGLDDAAWSDYGKLDVTGNVVMAFSGEPKGKDGNYFISGAKEPSRKAYYFSKAATAMQKGAAGLLVVAGQEKDYRRFTDGMEEVLGSAQISYPGESVPDTFFTAYVHPEAAARLLGIRPAELEKARERIGRNRVSLTGKYSTGLEVDAERECYPVNTENVVGRIEGTALKEQAVVVVAHYDHLGRNGEEIFYGADDNASGTAAVLEIAEAFAEAAGQGVRPRRSVLFLLVSGEEMGLYGSRYYTENPLVAMDSTYACVNIDMIGREGERLMDDEDYMSGGAFISEELLEMARRNWEAAAPGVEFRMSYRERVTGGSDHWYFATDSIPSLFYFQGLHSDYHTGGDTPDKILYDRMEGITRSIFLTVWELANKEEELEIKN